MPRQTVSGSGLFMTTYPTITGSGADGNSGDKRAGEDFLRNRKRRKRLFPNGKAFSPPFGSKMSGVQIPSLRPKRSYRPLVYEVFFYFCVLFFFCVNLLAKLDIQILV